MEASRNQSTNGYPTGPVSLRHDEIVRGFRRITLDGNNRQESIRRERRRRVRIVVRPQGRRNQAPHDLRTLLQNIRSHNIRWNGEMMNMPEAQRVAGAIGLVDATSIREIMKAKDDEIAYIRKKLEKAETEFQRIKREIQAKHVQLMNEQQLKLERSDQAFVLYRAKYRQSQHENAILKAQIEALRNRPIV